MTKTYILFNSMFRKHETSQIREEETFSSKRCLEWFYEYAGEFVFYLFTYGLCHRRVHLQLDTGIFALAVLVSSGCDDVVGPEGMEKFCEDIGVEPENV